MNNVYNWTKDDVALINRKLADRSVFKYNGVVFYKSISNSSDAYHVAMNDFISNLGGACFIVTKYDWCLEAVKDHPQSIVGEIIQAADVDENGQFMMIAFQDKLFQEKHDSIRPFVIAHEMAHLANGDHLDPQNRTEVYCGNVDQEAAADAYAILLLGTNESAKKFFDMALSKIDVALGMSLTPEQMNTISTMKKSMETRTSHAGQAF